MKLIQIFETSKNYKIVTLYKRHLSSYISSEPVYIVQKDIDDATFFEKISSALNFSREIMESEEDRYWLGNKLLKILKETSFEKLYSKSSCCSVALEKGNFIIKPYIYMGKGNGMTADDSASIVVPIHSDNNSVIEKVKASLEQSALMSSKQLGN